MNEKELRAKFQPKKLDNQVQFDYFMQALNAQQTQDNHPLLDRIRELNQRKALIESQRKMLNAQLEAIKVERLDIEQQQKEINRAYHAIKHELIELNPKGLKNEPAED